MAALVMMLILGTLAGVVIAALGHPAIYGLFFTNSKHDSLDH